MAMTMKILDAVDLDAKIEDLNNHGFDYKLLGEIRVAGGGYLRYYDYGDQFGEVTKEHKIICISSLNKSWTFTNASNAITNRNPANVRSFSSWYENELGRAKGSKKIIKQLTDNEIGTAKGEYFEDRLKQIEKFTYDDLFSDKNHFWESGFYSKDEIFRQHIDDDQALEMTLAYGKNLAEENMFASIKKHAQDEQRSKLDKKLDKKIFLESKPTRKNQFANNDQKEFLNYAVDIYKNFVNQQIVVAQDKFYGNQKDDGLPALDR